MPLKPNETGLQADQEIQPQLPRWALLLPGISPESGRPLWRPKGLQMLLRPSPRGAAFWGALCRFSGEPLLQWLLANPWPFLV